MVKPSLLLRPEEINEVFATPEGHDLYQKVHKDTEERTKSLLIQKMLESRAPNTIKEVQEKEESDTSEKNKMINSQGNYPQVIQNFSIDSKRASQPSLHLSIPF